jgi:betaine-aldehyde dehydrogenase
VDGALFGVFINQGEVCSAGARVLVQRPIYKKMLDAMVEKAKRIRLGPGADRETKMGPLVSRAQMERVQRYQEIGRREARLAVGGGPSRGRGPAARDTSWSPRSSTTWTTPPPSPARRSSGR